MSTNKQEEDIWRPVVGAEGFYEVSHLGKIRSLDRIVKKKKWGETRFKGGIRKLTIDDGYAKVCIYANQSKKIFQVHKLVVGAFWNMMKCPKNPLEYPELQVNHIDGIKNNNHIHNLELISSGDNTRHARLHLPRKKNPERWTNLTPRKVLSFYDHLKKGGTLLEFEKEHKCSHFVLLNIVWGRTWRRLNIDWSKVYNKKQL